MVTASITSFVCSCFSCYQNRTQSRWISTRRSLTLTSLTYTIIIVQPRVCSVPVNWRFMTSQRQNTSVTWTIAVKHLLPRQQHYGQVSGIKLQITNSFQVHEMWPGFDSAMWPGLKFAGRQVSTQPRSQCYPRGREVGFHRGRTSEHANKNKLCRQTSTLHRVLNTGKRPKKNGKSTEWWKNWNLSLKSLNFSLQIFIFLSIQEIEKNLKFHFARYGKTNSTTWTYCSLITFYLNGHILGFQTDSKFRNTIIWLDACFWECKC